MAINGTAKFVYYPNSNRASMVNSGRQRLKSVNQPLVYKLAIERGQQGQNYNPTQPFDVVNVLFDVYVSRAPLLQTIDASNLVATIRKAQDIPRKVYDNALNTFIAANGFGGNTSSGETPGFRTFTVDLRSILQPFLGYGLIPVGRGSFNQWQLQGHIGGGYTNDYGDNIWTGIQQGLAVIDVKARFEILNSQKQIEIAQSAFGDQTINTVGNTMGGFGKSLCLINAVVQNSENTAVVYQGNQEGSSIKLATADKRFEFLSRCQNGNISSSWTTAKYFKSIRMNDRQEALYFFMESVVMSATLSTFSGKYFRQSSIYDIYFKVEAVDSSNNSTGIKYLDAPTDAFFYSIGHMQDPLIYGPGFTPGNYLACPAEPLAWLAQNVSPAYINASPGSGTATPIVASTVKYRVSIVWENNESGSCDGAVGATGTACDNAGGVWTGTTYKATEYRYFKIDRENENNDDSAFPYVRVHWLNSMGGIDSYTFKRNKTQSISRKVSTYERKPNDPQWSQQTLNGGDTDIMVDQTLNTAKALDLTLELGNDQYKTSTEVLQVTSIKSGKVFSEPLTNDEAEWLSELMKSPNVWVQVRNAHADVSATKNRSVFQGTTGGVTYNNWYTESEDYSPIIINEGNMTTVNEDKGLVMMELQYRDGNAEMTQSN